MAIQFKKSIEADSGVSPTISKFMGTKDSTDIVCIVSNEHTVPLQTHYIEGYGSFHCFKGQCCLDHPRVSVSYVYPIIRYKMTGRGYDYSAPIDCMFIKASSDLYKDLKLFEETGGSLPDTDFVFKCTNPKFQEIKFSEASKKTGAKWKQDPELVKQVNDHIKSYELLIESALKIKDMDANKYDGLYESTEYKLAIERYNQYMLANGGNGNSNNQQRIITPTQPTRAISAPSRQDITVTSDDFDSLMGD